ncbi:MAG: NAD(P)H-dependent oxidoreductase [Leptospiraceae bacterium]|nr:NAD(P)H-dependent oxidoreductase [Leptospiraceae bacterium]
MFSAQKDQLALLELSKTLVKSMRLPLMACPMNPLSSASLLESMQWRYACKRFQSAQIIPAETLAALRELCSLAPSSYGLQPVKILDIQDPQLRSLLRKAANNKSQVTDASHFWVLCHRPVIKAADIDAWLELLQKKRGEKAADQTAYRDFLWSKMQSKNQPEQNCWAARQAYLVLGQLLAQAALLGIDACPMEGFDYDAFQQILQLDAAEWVISCAAALGYRDETDEWSGKVKVRRPVTDFFETVPRDVPG